MRHLLIMALAALGLAAQDVRLTREGVNWVRVTEGSINGPIQPRLQVSSSGRIVLRGVGGDRLTFKLTQKVRAHTEADARRMLGNFNASKFSSGGLTRLIVSPSESMAVTNLLEVNVPRQLPLAMLETQMGAIEAYDLDGGVQAMTPAGEIKIDRIDGFVNARTGGGEIHLGRIGGAIRCVSGGGSIFLERGGGEMNCGTAGGDLSVKEAGGPLTLSTQGGSIRVEHAMQTVEAHSAAGLIEVVEAGGRVIADTRGGSIQIGSSRGVKAESAAGAVRVKSASGPMSLSTAAGSIQAELLAGARMEDSSLVAGSGDITLFIPSNVAVSVMATNESGGNAHIVSDFPEVRASMIGFVVPLMAQGAINGGGPVMRLNAGRGVIYLRRVK